MKHKIIIAGLLVLASVSLAEARDVLVNGYYRSNGTYVQPHVRPSPDNVKGNNYGPSQTPSERMNPQSRDSDRDGIPNYRDRDDNNNGVQDDNET